MSRKLTYEELEKAAGALAGRVIWALKYCKASGSHETRLRRLIGQLHADCATWNLSPSDTRYVLEGVASRVRDAEQVEKRRKDKERK